MVIKSFFFGPLKNTVVFFANHVKREREMYHCCSRIEKIFSDVIGSDICFIKSKVLK